MASEEDELRARARRLLEKRQPIKVEDESHEYETHDSVPVRTKRKPSAGEIAKAAAAPGAGLVGVIALVTTLLQARVSPEQLKGLQERVDQLELERSRRRLYEYERDKVLNCRSEQTEGALRSLLPRPDSQVGHLPKPWFDKCPELEEPTTGVKATPK